jgi:hypothetical protein
VAFSRGYLSVSRKEGRIGKKLWNDIDKKTLKKSRNRSKGIYLGKKKN